MKKVIVDNEVIFLKKGLFSDWRVVHPIKINGSINWKNLLIGGSWINLAYLSFIIILLLVITKEYANAVTMLNSCLNKSFVIIP